MGQTHRPKGLRISDEVHRALRVRAAETGETMGEIAERALRKELGMMEVNIKLRWQVIEDNAGGLHLAVLEDGRCIYYGHGYERNEDGLRADVQALREGQHPIRDGWETQEDVADPQAAYDAMTRHEYGWAVVADDEGIYYERMGEAARRVFGEPYDGWVINTGFLGGNILSGYDERPVDEAASCARYKDMLHEALEKEFPGADIRVHYEVMASGATPLPMRTYVRRRTAWNTTRRRPRGRCDGCSGQ